MAVTDELGHELFTVIGHDRGALVALRAALHHPGRMSHLGSWPLLRFLDQRARRDPQRHPVGVPDSLRVPAAVRAICQDYRAGVLVGPGDDVTDRTNQRRLTMPTLVL